MNDQCEARTSSGKPCKGKGVRDGLCSYHRRDAEERQEWHRAGNRKSTSKRQGIVEEREALRDSARLGTQALIDARLLAEGEAYVDRLHRIALGDDDGRSLQALALLMDRGYGKPTQRVEERRASTLPSHEQWAAMGDEERAALLEALGG